ncbi:MAG: LacI family DNA-binding transcriptional regulator [Clostridia bacterium]|nr:LacI family DNA-binding transcriptional regulator [Clostridia bacterium]
MATQPTIRDVAILAGVSIGTVDRVLHNRGKVSKANLKAVQGAIEALNYRPSQIARALVTRRSNLTIGVCIPFVEREFWAEARSGVYQAAEKLKPFGVEVALKEVGSYDIDAQLTAIRELVGQGVNAIVLTPVQGGITTQLDDIIPDDIPFATVVEDTPQTRRLFHVGPDDYAMGKVLGRLASLYCGEAIRCVIFAPNYIFQGTQSRIRGFCDFLKAETPEAQILEIAQMPLENEMAGYQTIFDETRQQIQAHGDLNLVYVTNGLTQWAAAAVKTCRMQGRIDVFGFERTEMTQQYMDEDIIRATVCQRPFQQMYTAVTYMYEHLLGQRTFETPIIPAECRILIKESMALMRTGTAIDE